MKNIDKLVEKCMREDISGTCTALSVSKELFPNIISYFNNVGLTDYVNKLINNEIYNLVIDFCNEKHELSYGIINWYIDYNIITLTKEDFKDITENEDNRTFILMLYNRPVINSQSNTIYFNEEEYNQYLDTLDNLRDVIIIPTYGKHFERTAHISFY